MTSRYNQIRLLGSDQIYEEAIAIQAITPGSLLDIDTNGKVLPSANPGRIGPVRLALEQGLSAGFGLPPQIMDNYAIGDVVPYIFPKPGTVNAVLLQGGNPAVSIGTPLINSGDSDGTVITNTPAGSRLFESVADSAALTNTVTPTVFDKSYNIPANFLIAGDIIKVRAEVVATATHSTDTLTVLLALDGVTVITTGAVDVADGNVAYIDALIIIRTIGAGGTFIANGTQILAATGTAPKDFKLDSSAIDTTVANLIAVQGTWSVADPGNSCVLRQLSVELQRGSLATICTAEEAFDNSAGTSPVLLAARFL